MLLLKLYFFISIQLQLLTTVNSFRIFVMYKQSCLMKEIIDSICTINSYLNTDIYLLIDEDSFTLCGLSSNITFKTFEETKIFLNGMLIACTHSN